MVESHLGRQYPAAGIARPIKSCGPVRHSFLPGNPLRPGRLRPARCQDNCAGANLQLKHRLQLDPGMNGPRKALRQIVWLPDERLRLASYGGHPGAAGLCRDRQRRGRRSRHPQYLPYPREGGREGLFRAWPRAPHEGGAPPRKAATSSSRSPAASPRPRARRSSAARRRSISSSGRRAITGCPICLARAERDGKAVDTEFPADDKFDHLAAPSAAAIRARGVSRLRHGAGRLRQVLHLLRRALYARRRNLAAGRQNCRRDRAAGGRRRARNHADRTERQRLSRRRTGRAAWSLARLLERVARIAGIDRLRYTTSHPRDMDDDLIAAHRDLPQLMPQLHLPVQSGSDRILAAMNRRHTRADYLDSRRRLRDARPDIALTSDFIVGFPGETEDDFAATLRLIDEVGFSGAFSFKYSPRPGTPGADMDDQVAEDVKSERLQRLQEAIDRNQAAFNRSCIGRTFDVLFERPGRHPGQLVGRSPYLQPVQVEAPASLIGEIAAVTSPSRQPTACSARLRMSRAPAAEQTAAPALRAQEPELRTPRNGRIALRRAGQCGPDRAHLRRQSPRLLAVRAIRPKSRLDRAPARRRRQFARQPCHDRRLARSLRAGAPRARKPL